MKIEIDLEVCCPKCGEMDLIDWQITRNHKKFKLLVDIVCPVCESFNRLEVDIKQTEGKEQVTNG